MGKRTPCACRLCVRVRMRAQLWAGEQGSARRDYLGISTTGPPTHTHTRTHTYADAHPRTPTHTCTHRYACAVGDGRAVDVGATSAERQSCRRPPAPTPPSHTSKCPPRHTHTHMRLRITHTRKRALIPVPNLTPHTRPHARVHVSASRRGCGSTRWWARARARARTRSSVQRRVAQPCNSSAVGRRREGRGRHVRAYSGTVGDTHTRVRLTPACAELLWRLPSGCAVGRPCARWAACADACRPIHDGGERNAARRRRLAALSVRQQSTHGSSAHGKRVAAHIPGCTSPRRCCVTITSPRQSVHGAMSISLAGRAPWRTSCDSSHA